MVRASLLPACAGDISLRYLRAGIFLMSSPLSGFQTRSKSSSDRVISERPSLLHSRCCTGETPEIVRTSGPSESQALIPAKAVSRLFLDSRLSFSFSRPQKKAENAMDSEPGAILVTPERVGEGSVSAWEAYFCPHLRNPHTLLPWLMPSEAAEPAGSASAPGCRPQRRR